MPKRITKYAINRAIVHILNNDRFPDKHCLLLKERKICSNTVVTIGDHVLDLHIHLAGHVTQEGEDDEAPKDTGHAVPQRHQEGIPDPDKQRVP